MSPGVFKIDQVDDTQIGYGLKGVAAPTQQRSLGSDRLAARATSPHVTELNRARTRTTTAGERGGAYPAPLSSGRPRAGHAAAPA